MLAPLDDTGARLLQSAASDESQPLELRRMGAAAAATHATVIAECVAGGAAAPAAADAVVSAVVAVAESELEEHALAVRRVHASWYSY
jgi:hypothetical protein